MKKVFIRANPGEFVNYTNALTACGVEPVLSMNLADADACDALLVPGGADVIDAFHKAGKPILGICRGHQIINVAFGGDMIQHVPFAERHVSLGEKGDNVHMVRALHPFIQEMYGEYFPVNSSHHQAADHLGEGLIPTCVNDEGINEGFIHANGRVIGVQFHPERIGFLNRRPDTVDGEKLFRAFVALL